MNKTILLRGLSLCLFFYCISLFAQSNHNAYVASEKHPYGQLNPNAPKEVADYAPMIGLCNCESISRNPDQTWADPVDMTWTFKYIMNGMGVQDETIKEDGKHSGSIRQFIPDSARWYVHYYSSATPSTTLSAWEGGTDEGDIILYRKQQAPNGLDGFFKITFSDISSEGFNWLGEWVNTDESFSFPTWKISCKKKREKR